MRLGCWRQQRTQQALARLWQQPQLQDAPTCSSTSQGIKEEESTTDQGSGTASSARPVLQVCSSAPADDVLCSMPAPQKATFEYVDNSSGSAHAAAAPAEAPYHERGTLHYRLGSIHHSARNFFGFRSAIKGRCWHGLSQVNWASSTLRQERSRPLPRQQPPALLSFTPTHRMAKRKSLT